MLVLPVASSLSHQLPSIVFEQANELAELHLRIVPSLSAGPRAYWSVRPIAGQCASATCQAQSAVHASRPHTARPNLAVRGFPIPSAPPQTATTA